MNSKKLRAHFLILLLMAAFALSASPALADSAPGAVSSVSLTRSDGTVTASWDAPSGATQYHVTYSDDGGASWSLAAYGEASASVSFGADNAKTYVVGVRAGNEHGWSGWTNSPAAGPYTPPTPTPTPTPPPAPDAPSSVTVTRSDGTVTASWDAPSGATQYHVTYSDNGGASWSLAAYGDASTSVSFSADNAKTYVVGVRAGNAGGWSGWTNSDTADPYTPPTPPDAPSSVTVTRADGTLTASWDAPSGATKYHVTYTSDWGQSWTSAADAHASTTITISADNARAYTVGVRAGNDGGWSDWTNSPLAHSYFPPERGIIIQDADGNPITALAVPEGGEAGYYVKLAAPPSETTKVCVYLSVRDKNDPDITFKGEAADVVSIDVIFTPDNWDTPQTVTLVAAEDDDSVNGARDSGLDAREYYAGKVDLAVTEIDNDLPAPTNFTVTNGDGFFDLAWSAVTDATGYDVRAKISNSASWSSVATGVTATSYQYTTSAVVNKLAVRATSANKSSAWTELSRGPADDWLTTVQTVQQANASAGLKMAAAKSGASAQSVQGQSQLAAPASITVTRENNIRDEKLYVSWSTVSGAEGYNLACANQPSTQPLTSWTWWHCGSVTSGSITTFTVDDDKRGGVTRDLGYSRSYTVAVRAVTSNSDDASAWTMSADAHPALPPDPGLVSTSRDPGSVSVSWTPSRWSQGYKIYCAVRENNVNGAYTVCANVQNQTLVNGRITATISSWTAGGTNYTIDDSKTYSLSINTTNNWGEAYGTLAQPILPGAELILSNLTSTKSGDSDIASLLQQAVAFSTGTRSDGYTLKAITIPLKYKGSNRSQSEGVTLTLRAMQGTGQYSSTSAPSDTVLATLTGTAPAASSWTDTTFTCSGSGCNLSANTTYFIVATTTDVSPAYAWAYAATETQTQQPSGSGWDIKFGHNIIPVLGRTWSSYSDYNITELVFAMFGLSNSLTATGAKLTIAGHSGDWYYKYTSPSGGTCSSAVSGASATVTLTAGSYIFAAYSDASCTSLLATTIITGETSAAPASVTAVATADKELSTSWQQPLWATKYHVTYTCNNGGDWGLVANGAVASEGNLSQTGQTVTATVDLSAGWWNNQSPQCRMGVRAGNHNGWSSWAESNSVTPQ